MRLAGDHFPRSIEFLCSYRADTCDSSSTQWKMLATTNKKFVIERGPPSHETRPGVSSAQMSHLSSIKSLPRPNHRIIIHFACSLNRMSSTRTSWLCISCNDLTLAKCTVGLWLFYYLADLLFSSGILAGPLLLVPLFRSSMMMLLKLKGYTLPVPRWMLLIEK